MIRIRFHATARRDGSVLIIVLWIAFGLVSLTLYFANSMSLEMRAADNRAAGIEASQAIAGAARYLTNLLATTDEPAQIPQRNSYRAENVQIGDGAFWLIGRGAQQSSATAPYFALADEGAKLDLNKATTTMLEALPRMTPELAAAIVDWRDTDDEPSPGGAENETYLARNPAYECKNGPFESVQELRLVYGMTLEILYGEDTNRNGILDTNENDGEASPPSDNRDGRLDPGLIEYLTVHTHPATTASDGTACVDLAATNISQDQVRSTLEERLGSDRAGEIIGRLNITAGFSSVLEFYTRSEMAAEEFATVEEYFYVSTANDGGGLVNVNTAPEEVLACIPGIGTENAPALVARRQSNSASNQSLAWVTEILDTDAQRQAGPCITGKTHQFNVDIAAVGRYGRGFRRVSFIIDTTGGMPKFIARRDLTSLGWPLGKNVRENLLVSQRNR